MSVGRSGSTGDRPHYQDLIQQVWAIEVLQNNNANDEKTKFEGDFTIDPADGVDRGEVFELAAAEVQWRLAPPDTVNDMSNMALRAELSFQPQLVNQIDDLSSTIDKVTEGGTSSTWTVLGDPDGSLEDDLIWWINDRAETGFVNGTDSAGGSGTNTMMHREMINFYDQFGSGPQVDRHDLLYFNFVTNERFTADNYAFHFGVRLWWDMVEEASNPRR